ncbi:MAG: electron transfer flavoprotein subunit beta/FixA family protein [Spirochaetia bacterium]|nr:electron transfer flavoprotein subunit beta/FixA family protein [Spirochaetia bacterium]
MRIVCVVKFVPDVDNFTYNYETHTIEREHSPMLINPDDARALGFALTMKKREPQTCIEVVTMAPRSVIPQLEDILRLGFDSATLISDQLFAGSDTYVTSKLLSSVIRKIPYDCILSGTHAIDGDTSHVPSQIAQSLDLDHLNFIHHIEEERFTCSSAVVEVEGESSYTTFEIALPALLSLTRESAYRLPYVRYKNLNLDVSERLHILTNEQLGFDPAEVGLSGSRTQVVSTHTKEHMTRRKKVVKSDDEGIEVIYTFLKSNGFI